MTLRVNRNTQSVNPVRDDADASCGQDGQDLIKLVHEFQDLAWQE